MPFDTPPVRREVRTIEAAFMRSPKERFREGADQVVRSISKPCSVFVKSQE
jgi:hypothetical protein